MDQKKTFDTRNDIAPEIRASMIELLNRHTANIFDLYSQTKQAHWNVKGIHFMALHEFFDEAAAAIFPYVDMMAERTTALGGYAYGTARMAATATDLAEWPIDAIKGEDVLRALADRYGHAAEMIRQAIDTADAAGDMDTADLFTGVSRELDKQLWFIEAHLQA
jgi:starvation-inducible DNA-binding protein